MTEKTQKIFNTGILSGNRLKIIAAVSMTVDHIGAYVLNDWTVLRIAGRPAFPIFAYMIAEGCTHTKNRKKYLMRMAVSALIYQTARFAVSGSLFLCILATFTLSILLICTIDYAQTRRDAKSKALAAAAFALVFVITEALPRIFSGFGVDYGFFGVLMPVAVYAAKTRRDKLIMAAVSTFCLAGALGGLQWFSLSAIPLLAIYNNRRGRQNMKYFFYTYYFSHTAVLYAIGLILKNFR